MVPQNVPYGVWPTLVTPYLENREIDYGSLEKFIEWLVARGVTGLFAVCKSSEMFALSRRERLELSRAIVRLAEGKAGVVSSGHTAWSLVDQIEEVKAMADTGPSAVVLITNRFAAEREDDSVFIRNLERLLRGVPENIRLGLYECPYPYKRVLSPALTRFVVSTGRFDFLKDTCCDIGLIREKLAIAKDSSFLIYNANAATLLDSLRAGAAGYSGVMANFHPQLYAKLCRDWRKDEAVAEELQAFLGTASLIELQAYPLNAMYTLVREGVFSTIKSRMLDSADFSESMKTETEQMNSLVAAYSARFPLNLSQQ